MIKFVTVILTVLIVSSVSQASRTVESNEQSRFVIRLSNVPGMESQLTIHLKKAADDPDNGPEWRKQLIQAAQAPVQTSYPSPVIELTEIAESLGLSETNLKLDYFMATYGGTVKAVFKSRILDQFFDGYYHRLFWYIQNQDPSAQSIRLPVFLLSQPWLAYPTSLNRMTNLQSLEFYYNWDTRDVPHASPRDSSMNLPCFMLFKTHPILSKLSSLKFGGALPGLVQGWTNGLANFKSLDLGSPWNSIASFSKDLFKLSNLIQLGLHSSVNLSGPGFSQWGNLSALDLSSSYPLVLPPELGTLVQLKSLNLSENSTYDKPLPPMPDILAKLSNLETLDLSNNNYHDQTFPFNPGPGVMPKLKVLDLSSNSMIVNLPQRIGDLSSLEDLSADLYGTNDLPDTLTALSTLRRFACHNSKNNLWEGLVRMTQLTCLSVRFNVSVLGTGSELGLPPLTNLRELSALFNGSKDSDYLSKLTRLEKLTLTSRQNWVPDTPVLGMLLNLTDLDLSDLLIPDVPLNTASLPRLQRLCCTCSPALQQGTWPALTQLMLNDPDDIGSEIGMCFNLESLTITGGDLGGRYDGLPRELMYLTKLTSLQMLNNRQAGKTQGCLEVIYLLESLKHLSVRGSLLPIVTDNIKYLTRLEQLDLSVYQMQQISPHIGDLIYLNKLIMSLRGGDSPLITSLPDTVTNLTNLVKLDVSALRVSQLPQALFDRGVDIDGLMRAK